jgi:hypothetical protein
MNPRERVMPALDHAGVIVLSSVKRLYVLVSANSKQQRLFVSHVIDSTDK